MQRAAVHPFPYVRGFAAAELIMALAVMGLLLSFGVAAASRARQFDSKTQCLANMREIGRASWLYATDDEREQIVALTRAHVRRESEIGFEPELWWSWRTGEPFSCGGRTPVTPMPTSFGAITIMTEPTSVWAEERRPLNSYMTGAARDAGSLETFHCPVDRGYPDAEWMSGAPREAADIPCWDFVGNSYRINTTGLVYTSSGGGAAASFGTAPCGHAASTIASPAAETVLYAEPLFYNLVSIWRGSNPTPEAFGWHGYLKADNVLFLDGSARLVRIDPLREFTQAELEQMNFDPHFYQYYWYFLRRGPGWQMDVYPTPGAYLSRFDPGAVTVPTGGTSEYWPWQNFQQNLPPE